VVKFLNLCNSTFGRLKVHADALRTAGFSLTKKARWPYPVTQGAAMKPSVPVCVLTFFAFLSWGCVTSEAYFEKISAMRIPTPAQSRKVVNLKTSTFMNTREKTYGDKLMKNGFLDTGTEEYGYYFFNTRWTIESDNTVLIIFSACTLGILQLVGVPYNIDTYYVTGDIDLFDSNGILIRSFTGSGVFRQAVGYYYGRDNSERVHEEFLKIVTDIQNSINDQSEYINDKLRESGPITAGNSEEAARNMLLYLASRYNRVLKSQSATQPGDTLKNPAVDSFRALSVSIPDNSVITLVNIHSDNQTESHQTLNELMVQFVNAKKYIIVDRADVEKIEKEQNFQLSGFVNDDSVVSIGQFLGADVVITGSISGTAGNRRLMLKALDVKTAQIIAASSVRM
jgi:hypothetical protein